MAQFQIDSVEPLDYDFTGFPKNDGKGKCTGKGTVPEPTKKLLMAYSASLRKVYGLDDEGEEDVKEAVEKDKMNSEERQDEMLSLTSALCQNSPTAAELKQLPPRILAAFMKWVYEELSNPEVSSADTRR